MEIAEGFICPVCRKSLAGPGELMQHFDLAHPAQKEEQQKQGMARRKISPD